MKSTFVRSLLLFLIVIAPFHSYCHDLHDDHVILREWSLNDSSKVNASLLMFKEELVYLQLEDSKVVHFPLASFSANDRQFILHKYGEILQLNAGSHPVEQPLSSSALSPFEVLVVLLTLVILFIMVYLRGDRLRFRQLGMLSVVTVSVLLFSFSRTTSMQPFSVTDPLFVDSAFAPFKPEVVTSWDSNYFYVESHGIPATHGMMTGITSWQQQVPIPQCYIKPNAWMIPLNPVVAAVPVPVDSIHFTRGAIAVAINGVPIFNYHTNTGVDAYLDGQLDQWGGHCGRADDYHYHIAPLQLYNQTPATKPIAFALDGFAVYGSLEPDGTLMLPLDANNGHYGSNGVYHYHGVAAAPYMIGSMVGEITEDTTHQIIPQPHAQPVRPSLTPLTGATITGCTPNGNNNGYSLTYSLNGNTDSIVYSWTPNGVYSFNFYTTSGSSSATYNGFAPCALPTGVNEVMGYDETFQLYPNPAHHSFSIVSEGNLNTANIRRIQIYSSNGHIVFSGTEYHRPIITSQFSRGVYIVLITVGDKVFSEKLIVQ